eukprot:8919085-Pyramimonas_sp.AAC.2
MLHPAELRVAPSGPSGEAFRGLVYDVRLTPGAKGPAAVAADVPCPDKKAASDTESQYWCGIASP